MWDREFARLSTHHRVLRYDMRGFGRSPDPVGDYFDHVDLLDVMSDAGFDAAVLVGASDGVRIALDAAVTAPARVRAMTLLGPLLPGMPAPDGLSARLRTGDRALRRGDIATARAIVLELWIDGVGRQRAGAHVRARVADWLDDLLPRQARRLRWQVGEAQMIEPLARDRLRDVVAPTLVIVGAHDQLRVHAAAHRLADCIADCRVAIVDDAAHLPHLEVPGVVDALLDEFLARV
jgi:pimeloyl-ACP methyl ester carboxylesterase